MAIPSGLLGKGLFGLCLVGSGAGGYVFGKDIYFYFAKTDTKLSILGLPETCRLVNEKSKECADISKDSLQKILFKNKEDNKSLTVTGLEPNSTIKIKVEETDDTETFPYGLKFTIISEKDLEIKKGDNDDTDKIIVKKNTNTEFKINNRRLEKAWTADSLAKKVGLKECKGDSGKKCTIEANKAISYSVNDNAIKKLTISGSNDDPDKITYSENEAEYNQGFKFIVGSSSVTGAGADGATSSEQLDANTDYEVKYKEGNEGGWYLSKKTTS